MQRGLKEVSVGLQAEFGVRGRRTQPGELRFAKAMREERAPAGIAHQGLTCHGS